MAKKTQKSKSVKNWSAELDKITKYRETDTSMVNQAYIDSLMKDASNYFKTADADYGKVNWGNAASSYEARNSAWNDLSKRADTVSAWLYHNRNSLNDDAYNYYNNYLDSIYEGGRGIVDSFKNYSDYFGNWSSQEEYDKWYSDYQETQRMANSKEGKAGWQKYLSDQSTPKESIPWWQEAILRGHATSNDNPAAMAFNTAVYDYQRDESYRAPSDNWTDDERNVFGYYYATNPAKAFTYAADLNNQKNLEQEQKKMVEIVQNATSNFGSGAVNSLGALFAATTGLADTLNYLAMLAANRPITEDGFVSPFEYSQAVQSGISSKLNEMSGTLNVGGMDIGLGNLYGVGMSIASSQLSGRALGAVGTLVNFFGQGAAQGVKEAKQMGATDEQALLYGSLSGAFEGIAEMIGFDHLTSGLTSASTMKAALKNIIAQAGAEGLEEGWTSLANSAIDIWVLQDKGKILGKVNELMANGVSEADAKKQVLNETFGEALYDTITGAISGAVGGGIETGVKNHNINTQFKNEYIKDPDSLKSLLEGIALENPSVDTSKLMEKYRKGEKISANELRKFVYANEQSVWNQDKSKLVDSTEKRLSELGEQGDLRKLAESIVNAQYGYSFDDAILDSEQAILNNEGMSVKDLSYLVAEYSQNAQNKAKLSKADQKAIRESEYGSRVSNELNPNMRDETSSAWAQGVKTNRLGNTAENVAKTRVALAQLNEASKSQKKLSSDAISYKSGVVDASLTPKGRDAKIEGENKSVSETYARAEGYKGLANETFSKYYKGENIEEYALGFREAYDYGLNGTVKDVKDLSNHGSFKSYINEEAREMAFNAGVVDAKYMGIKGKTIKVDGDYKVTVPMSNKALSESKQATIELMKVLAPIAKVNMSTMVSLKDHGLYDPKTNTIYIDLAMDGRDVMIFTLSHELTHHLKRVNPEQFDEFARALFEEVGKTENVEERLAKWMRENKKYYPNMAQAEFKALAREEVVAEMCESFLTDEKVVQRISQKVYEADKGLWNTIKKWFENLVAKLKKLFADLDPQSENGRIVREMGDRLDSVRQMWADMVVEAGDIATELGIELDAKSESVSPTLIHSRKTWEESDYVLNRDIMAEKIASALNVSERKAKKYIDDINSIARIISNDRARLDYQASSFGSAFVSNVEYGGSFDYTTLCKKRRIYTGTFSEIQKRLHDVALTPDDILKIRNLMIEQGIEATCGLCYVEGSRANMGKFAQKFIELYKRDNPNAWIPTMADVNTPDGVEQMRINHPEVYESYEYFWNHYGKLKESDPALFASQQKPKLYEARKEYKGEILTHFKGETAIGKKNLNGGIRMQSFSDFEIVHLIDTMQVIMDMSTVGLAGQAYTKVPEFALAFGDTGLKINLSLIAKGVNESGELTFDDREGMPHETAFDIRNKYSKNVGTIIVTFTDEQLMAAMADDRIDFIIPFHRSQWKKGQYGAMGLPKGTKDYTFMQNEKLIKQTYHEYQGRMVKDKATNYMPNEYWDFSKSGKENAEKYLKMCAENNKRPKFYKLLDYDGNGTYSLKKDGSTDGYWKLLIDFKMYDNNGKGSPQTPVIPRFNMEESTKMLDEYKGGHEKYPIAYDVVDKFVEQYNRDNDTRYSHKNGIDNHKKWRYNKGAEYLIHNFSGFVDVDYVELYLDDQETAIIASAIKTGWGRIDHTRTFGGVYTSEAYYLFKYNDDHSITVFASFDLDAEAQIIQYIEEGFNDNQDRKSGRGETSSFGSWITDIRSRPTGRLVDSSNGSWEARETGSTDGMDGKPPISDTGANIGQGSSTDRIKSSRKNVDPITSREELAKALSKVAKGEDRAIVESYKANVNLIKGETARLESLRKEIDEIKYKKSITYEGRELSVKEFEQIAYTRAEEIGIDAERVKFKALKESGKYIATVDGKKILEAEKRFRTKDDIDKLATLEQNYQATIKRITTYDKKLLQIEAMSSIKQLINREKKASYDKAKAEGKEALKEYKAQAIAEQKKITERYQEMRKKNVEGRKTTEMRHKLMNTVHTLDQLLVNPTKKKHIPIGLQKPVAEALNILNTDTVGAEERLAKITAELKTTDDPFEINRLLESYNRIKAQGDKIKEKIDSLKAAYDKLLTSDDEIIRNSHDEVISNMIQNASEKIGDKAVRDMTYDELEMLYKMYRAILKTVRDANTSFKMAKGEEISTLGQSVMGELAGFERKNKEQIKLIADIKDGAEWYQWNNLKPIYAFKRIGSSTLETLYENVRRGEDTWAVDMSEARAFSDAEKTKFGYSKWDMDKSYTFRTRSGKDFKLTLGQIMSIYAYTKRGEQAINHLVEGGFVYDGTTEIKKNVKGNIEIAYELKDSTAYRLSEEIIGQINATLTPAQKSFVDSMQNYLSTVMGEKGNEVSLALYDIKLFGEKNYFPLKSSQVFLERAREQARGEVKVKNKGFTKETTPKANNPIVLESFMDVWANHCVEMGMYHAFTLPLEDFYRVYNYKERATDEKDSESVIMHLENAFGNSATKYIDQLLVDINGGTRADPRINFSSRWIAKFKKAKTFLSASVVIQQPSAVTRAMALIDGKYFIEKPTNHKATWNEIKKYAPVAIIKEMGYFDTGMGLSSKDWLKNEPTKMEKAEEALSKAPAYADEIGWNIIWRAVKREIADTTNLKVNSEEFLKKCGERFTEVITMTQVYDSVFARSSLMRSKDGLAKMLTAFMAEPTTTINMLTYGLNQRVRGNKGVMSHFVGACLTSAILNSMLVSIVYAARDDDEDEEYWEKYFGALGKQTIDSVNVFKMMPFIKDMVSIFEGFTVSRTDVSLITDIYWAWQKLDNDNISAYKKVEDFAGSIAAIFGVPLKNLMRDLRALWNLITSSMK